MIFVDKKMYEKNQQIGQKDPHYVKRQLRTGSMLITMESKKWTCAPENWTRGQTILGP